MWKYCVSMSMFIYSLPRQIPVVTKIYEKQSTNASISQSASVCDLCTFSHPIAINAHWDNVHSAQGTFHGCNNGRTDQYNILFPISILCYLMSCVFFYFHRSTNYVILVTAQLIVMATHMVLAGYILYSLPNNQILLCWLPFCL